MSLLSAFSTKFSYSLDTHRRRTLHCDINAPAPSPFQNPIFNDFNVTVSLICWFTLLFRLILPSFDSPALP